MMIILPIALYLLFYLPFIGVTPYYDGAKEFRFAYNLYTGHYLSNWIPFHPPFKLLLSALFFRFFGYESYTYLGLCLGTIGIAAFYGIGKALFDKKTALWSSIFLATSGLYLSTGLFSLTDFVMTVLILIAFWCYIHQKNWCYGLLTSCAVLTKEPALLFPFSVLLVTLLVQKKLTVALLFPFITFQAWLWFLHLTGHQAWNDWNFSSTAKQGSFHTVLHNLITFGFFNKYAYENWKHLFLFNFNWVFAILAVIGIISVVVQRRKQKNLSAIIIVLFFCISYAIAILSFQTFSITRYTLPILVFMYLFAGYGLAMLQRKLRYICLTIICIIIFISLLTSNDPISNLLWKKNTQLGQTIYISTIGGPDAISYNLQFLIIARNRDILIRQGNCKLSYSQLEYRALLFSVLHIPRCKNLEKS